MIKIIKKDKITSTNTWSKENIEILDDKTIVSANCQSKGRGRFVRKWVSDNPENIYMSFILKPKCDDFSKLSLANLTQYLALSLAKILEEYGIQPKIKWPNDILVNNKKISGILAELVIKNGNFLGLVLGLGLNLNMKEEELKQIDKPATSLNLETKQQFSKDEILQKIIDKFFANYDNFLKNGFKSIREEYLKYFFLMNENVKINLEFKFVEGKIIDVNENGVLLLQTKTGEIQEISIGDIL